MILRDRLEGQRQYFKVPIPLTAEELASLDSEFETLRFTPDGFSGVEGDVLMADLEKLTRGFVTPVARRQVGGVDSDEEEAPVAPKKISLKEIQAKQRAARGFKGQGCRVRLIFLRPLKIQRRLPSLKQRQNPR
jgi:hypothetical protein